MCCVKGANLSYNSLTSRAMRSELNSLKEVDPALYTELTNSPVAPAPTNVPLQEDRNEIDDELDDDSAIPLSTLAGVITGSRGAYDNIQVNDDGLLTCNAMSEASFANPASTSEPTPAKSTSAGPSTSGSAFTRPSRSSATKQIGFYAKAQFDWRR